MNYKKILLCSCFLLITFFSIIGICLLFNNSFTSVDFVSAEDSSQIDFTSGMTVKDPFTNLVDVEDHFVNFDGNPATYVNYSYDYALSPNTEYVLSYDLEIFSTSSNLLYVYVYYGTSAGAPMLSMAYLPVSWSNSGTVFSPGRITITFETPASFPGGHNNLIVRECSGLQGGISCSSFISNISLNYSKTSLYNKDISSLYETFDNTIHDENDIMHNDLRYTCSSVFPIVDLAGDLLAGDLTELDYTYYLRFMQVYNWNANLTFPSSALNGYLIFLDDNRVVDYLQLNSYVIINNNCYWVFDLNGLNLSVIDWQLNCVLVMYDLSENIIDSFYNPISHETTYYSYISQGSQYVQYGGYYSSLSFSGNFLLINSKNITFDSEINYASNFDYIGYHNNNYSYSYGGFDYQNFSFDYGFTYLDENSFSDIYNKSSDYYLYFYTLNADLWQGYLSLDYNSFGLTGSINDFLYNHSTTGYNSKIIIYYSLINSSTIRSLEIDLKDLSYYLTSSSSVNSYDSKLWSGVLNLYSLIQTNTSGVNSWASVDYCRIVFRLNAWYGEKDGAVNNYTINEDLAKMYGNWFFNDNLYLSFDNNALADLTNYSIYYLSDDISNIENNLTVISFNEGYLAGYEAGIVSMQLQTAQVDNLFTLSASLLGSFYGFLYTFLSFEVLGISLWAILIAIGSVGMILMLIKLIRK